MSEVVTQHQQWIRKRGLKDNKNIQLVFIAGVSSTTIRYRIRFTKRYYIVNREKFLREYVPYPTIPDA